jgi:hypothetical protein
MNTFNSPKEFMTANKSLIVSTLTNKFWAEKTNINTLCVDLFNYTNNSRFATLLVQLSVNGNHSKMVENMVNEFYNTTNYNTDYDAVADFNEHRDQVRINMAKLHN